MKITKQITNREGGSLALDKYLQDIAKVELLTPDQEVELARRIKTGDHAALEALTKANLRFVVSVAKQYQNHGLPLSDLINEGNLGLIKAAQRFDETKGFKFISYAVWWIRQSILQAIGDNARIVRLPLNRVGALNKINKTFNSLEQQLERSPNPEEIAKELEMEENDVSFALEISGRQLSMDAPFANSEDGSGNLFDVIPDAQQSQPDSTLMDNSLKEEINRVLSTLTEREAMIIKYYFGIDSDNALTLEELGEKLNLTRERVRQIKEKAIRRLRHSSRSRHLKTYLG